MLIWKWWHASVQPSYYTLAYVLVRVHVLSDEIIQVYLLRFGDVHVFESELAVSSPVDAWSVWQSVSPKTTNSHCLAPWPPPHSRPPAVGSPTPLPRSPRPCSVFNDPLVVSVYECGLLMHSGLPTPVATSTRLVHAINLMSLCDVTVWCWRHERTWLRHTPDKAMFFSECPCSISSSRHLSTADLFPYYYCYIIRV